MVRKLISKLYWKFVYPKEQNEDFFVKFMLCHVPPGINGRLVVGEVNGVMGHVEHKLDGIFEDGKLIGYQTTKDLDWIYRKGSEYDEFADYLKEKYRGTVPHGVGPQKRSTN